MQISQQLQLPSNFRRQDFFSFHQRDNHMLAEHWSAQQLSKGIFWNQLPARLQFSFTSPKTVQITLDIDSGRKKLSAEKTAQQLQQLTIHMLGLNQATAEFEQAAAQQPDISALVARQAGLRVPQAASPFEALSWAITGQQISLGAATAIRRNLIARAGVQHSSGIYCYPQAEHILALDLTDLRACGFSQSKAATLHGLAHLSNTEELPLAQWLNQYWNGAPLAAEEIYNRLIGIKGIGPWTVHYALLRGFGWLDGSLHGDVAVRRNLQQLLRTQNKFQSEEKISEAETKLWLARFSPWRALVAAHLWAMQKTEGY